MVSRADDMVETQAIAWIFYYLGIIDGTSATLRLSRG